MRGKCSINARKNCFIFSVDEECKQKKKNIRGPFKKGSFLLKSEISYLKNRVHFDELLFI